MVCVSSRNLPHRGFVPERRTTKLTLYHTVKTGDVQHDTEVECRLTFRLMAGISISDFSVKAALQCVVRGYMKELLTQTSLQNSSSPLLSLQTWTMWQQPDCFPCDSLPPHTPPALLRPLVWKGKRAHKHQCWSQVICFCFRVPVFVFTSLPLRTVTIYLDASKHLVALHQYCCS